MYQPPQEIPDQIKFYRALVALKITPEFQELYKVLFNNFSRVNAGLREEELDLRLRWAQGAGQAYEGLLNDIGQAQQKLSDILK